METKLKCKNSTRHRGENWSQREKDMFLEIMRHSAPIIENKATDTDTNNLKAAEWEKIQQKLEELHGTKRHVQQLKGFWNRKKIAAKKNMSQHKRTINIIGGGHLPLSPPKENHLKRRCMKLMEEEYNLKLKYQRQELYHQEVHQKMEIELLEMEKEKKALEIQILRKSLE